MPTRPNMKVLGNKWVFRVKQMIKAQLVAKTFHQTLGLDFNATFSPVVKLGTIILVLSITLLKN